MFTSRPKEGPFRQGPSYRVAVDVLKPLLMVFTRKQWDGVERLPREGGVIVVANHISVADPVGMARFIHDNQRRPRFLAKASLFSMPVVGWVLGGADQIPVHRDSRDAAKAFTAAVAAVKSGECVIIYPEGTTTRDPELWPMQARTGAARIALLTDAPVVPVAQWGAHELLPRGTKLPRLLPRKTLAFRVGEPVRLDDLREGPMTAEVLREATARILDAITAELEVLRGTKAPAERYDPRAHGAGEGGA
ncbi:1-acyl-sn-glycerol-3-phosphate acyltransferase [Motilibacter peucedani]|uniref:1-acyl-sn-glycerol-3-phosphate acyltransferase n=1 Tax=Motilibacter peucedani TaxID=598650 RepID=A0A420XUS5_9ACTN|nr:lysophospholipid acyltransferase family protein [Motilibacter peucedani]RKS80603.1 1-acyl-sn-glycerol-3-phosphate acyltransferase [Motilibacter peucedani]